MLRPLSQCPASVSKKRGLSLRSARSWTIASRLRAYFLSRTVLVKAQTSFFSPLRQRTCTRRKLSGCCWRNSVAPSSTRRQCSFHRIRRDLSTSLTHCFPLLSLKRGKSKVSTPLSKAESAWGKFPSSSHCRTLSTTISVHFLSASLCSR